jgi:hypothetical protein
LGPFGRHDSDVSRPLEPTYKSLAGPDGTGPEGTGLAESVEFDVEMERTGSIDMAASS